MTRDRYPRIAALKTADAFRAHLASSGIDIPFDDTLAPPASSPLAQPLDTGRVRVGNRFCVLPMEGWDGALDGTPSPLTERRWQRFGTSGAKLIWGGEAVAVRHDGRASPNQLQINTRTHAAIAGLRDTLVAAHRDHFGANADRDLLIGLQLTHSGRYAKPNATDRPEPLTAMSHPVLDRRFSSLRMMSDADIDRLIDDFIAAAKLAASAGFAFVDVKHCHGYFGHELLGARSREGKYGGTLDHRSRFLRGIVDGIRTEVPGLDIGVRLSAFDMVPYRKDASGEGAPEADAPPPSAAGFGIVTSDEDLDAALDDARALLEMLEDMSVRWVCITGGSPYYCPHAQRPAMFPPSDGYAPPEDPLRGVARQIDATARLKADFPGLVIVGSAYSYLQHWLPHVAQHVIRHGMADFIGLGRMVLSYPTMAADILAGAPLAQKFICRTFSDCTTGPRLAYTSGCYPLDPFYAARPEAATILKVRAQAHQK